MPVSYTHLWKIKYLQENFGKWQQNVRLYSQMELVLFRGWCRVCLLYTSAGETYIYLDAEKMGKLMVDDGTYVLTEDTAPDGYVARGELAVIEIKLYKA